MGFAKPGQKFDSLNRPIEEGRFGKDPKKDAVDEFDTILGQRPGAAPDFTDEVIHRAAQSQRLKTGRGRKSTFLSGPAGDTSPLTKGGPTLLGG